MESWYEYCSEIYKRNQTEETRTAYKYVVKNAILSKIGSIKIKEIRPIHLQEVLNDQAGRSRTQINMVYYTLQFLFRHAFANHIIVEDPTQNLQKPKHAPAKKRRALTPEERAVVIKVASLERRFYIYLLMLLCGCRPSEAAECRGSDIKQVNGVNILHIRGTKTAQSDRLVPIPDDLYTLIKNTPKAELIAPNKAGNRFDHRGQRRLWRWFTRKCNLELGCRTYRNKLVPPYPFAADLVPYCLRHEYCTDLARKGIDIRIAQKLMGHATITMTANIYTNLTVDDTITSVIDRLGVTKK